MNWQNPPVTTSSQPIASRPEPGIFWAGPNGGAPHFPSAKDFWLQHNRKVPGPTHRLQGFGDSVCSAIQRVWIIDKFFLGKPATEQGGDEVDSVESALEYLCDALLLSDVSSLRIITGARPEEARKAREDLLAARLEPAHGKVDPEEVKVAYVPRQEGCCSMRLVHDRFAIIDDMLWHFGATVGGVHWALNAASGPWDANKTNARTFFEDLWSKCIHF